MSATEELLQDHVFIRRLQLVIEKCYTLLYEGKDVPFGDLVKIADMIEQFVDNFHHGKEEKSYFPETEGRNNYSDEIRKFVIEHELGRRIANRVRIHLEEFLEGKDAREPLARYLKVYSVFILTTLQRRTGSLTTSGKSGRSQRRKKKISKKNLSA